MQEKLFSDIQVGLKTTLFGVTTTPFGVPIFNTVYSKPVFYIVAALRWLAIENSEFYNPLDNTEHLYIAI